MINDKPRQAEPDGEAAPRPTFLAIAAIIAFSRLAHRNILWADEDYHLAAGVQLLHGLVPYRDFWYDKPPLAALITLLFGALPGIPLRIAGTVLAMLVCWTGYLLAREWWGKREGLLAAALLAFYQVFDFPAAILPLEPDTWMVLPHLAAVLCAVRGRWWLAGAASAAAVLLTPKGALVLAAALLFVNSRHPAAYLKVLAGFAIPIAAAMGGLLAAGAAPGYFEQVWQWGWLYASNPGADPQAQKGWLAAASWLGFHLPLAAGALAFHRQVPGPSGRWRLAAWLILAAAFVALGGRLAPRYFNAILPPAAILAAAGLVRMPRRAMLAACALLLIPAARFGPRYVSLALEDLRGVPHAWQDTAMDRESRQAADWLRREAEPDDTVLIWGYRPNVVAHSRLRAGARYWDSQALTGVPADRHLSDSRPIAVEWAARNRAELLGSRATFLVDGLSAYNRDLDMHRYPEFNTLLRFYCEATRIGGITIYRRCP